MGFAYFEANYQHVPSTLIEELYSLLSETDGVMEWAVNQNGVVAVEYDHNRINNKIIEEILVDIGLQPIEKLTTGARPK